MKPIPSAFANQPRCPTARGKVRLAKTRGARAPAESFVDSFKAELIADRVRRTRAQLELAVVEYISWFNHDRLHEALEDIPPAEVETLYARVPDTRSMNNNQNLQTIMHAGVRPGG